MPCSVADVVHARSRRDGDNQSHEAMSTQSDYAPTVPWVVAAAVRRTGPAGTAGQTVVGKLTTGSGTGGQYDAPTTCARRHRGALAVPTHVRSQGLWPGLETGR